MFKWARSWEMLKIIILLCIMKGSWQQDDTSSPPANTYCVKGCLRCNPATLTCEICDIANNYIPTLNGKGCEVSSEENCSLMGKHLIFIFLH